MKKYILIILSIILIIALDQWTKYLIVSNFSVGDSTSVIPNFFSLTFVINRGAAFGFMSYGTDTIRLVLFKIAPIFICIYLIYLLITGKTLVGTISYTLIFAGAIGNLWDRFSLDYVVDFLDFYYRSTHFPAFNVADSAITVGVFLLILESFISKEKKG